MPGHRQETLRPSAPPALPNAAPAPAPAECFPVRIGHIPGRGRGFFATRDIAPGETVFRAAPLAWAVSEDWARNTCWWCFAHDSRRALPLKAAASSGPAGSAQHRVVFCSAMCAQSALYAHGGEERWAGYLHLLHTIETKIAAHKAGVARPPARRGHSTKAAVAASTADVEPAPPALAPFAAADFVPGEVSDAQLAEWISNVWDVIVAHQGRAAETPDSAQRELVRVIATELFLHGATPVHGSMSNCTADSPDWTERVVSLVAAEGGVAPPFALEHLRSSEIDHVRTRLRELQPAAPQRVPLNPTAAQVEGSWWGGAFRTAASSYALLHSAWQQTARTHAIGNLTHGRFRAVYFREMANSFGIYDPPATLHSLSPEGLGTRAVYQELEQEYLGSSIYPTAVYFNHSCCPNIAKTRVGRSMWFVSAVDISKGEELFISYGNITDPVAERRARLKEHFFFGCCCTRCARESVMATPDAAEPVSEEA
ncbi:hypothetical protein IWQ56_002770 [Coemansia nantahalensis]|nr:hypothetical protein IWQ56_002770 [Coemansia nantahalensis]